MVGPANTSCDVLPISIPRSPHNASDARADSTASTVVAPSHVTSQASNQHEQGTYSTLSKDVSNELLEWPEGGNKYFLPVDQFQRLVTVESISTELQGNERVLPHGYSYLSMAQIIFERFSKLFVILLLCDKVDSIYDFFNEGLDDSHLPFEKKDYKLFSKKHPSVQVQCTKNWFREVIRQFAWFQWSLNAPIFEKHRHYVLDKNDIMPFTMDASGDPNTTMPHGGFGEVSAVVIHSAHQSLRVPDAVEVRDLREPLLDLSLITIQGCEQHFAIKKLYSRDRSDFDREVKMLELFRDSRHHSHLAELLATYEQGGCFYLIFPFAKCDLKAYWKRTPLPHCTPLTVGWLLHQVKGLASAVQRIHGYADTWEAQRPNNPEGDSPSLDSATTEIPPPIYCRHGDITPPNILWSDDGDPNGILILADFGQMQQYTTTTEFRKAPEKVAESLAYSPPEASTYTTRAQTSRAYDIWSLGAIYLESLIWLLYGWDELCRFTQARGETFYTLIDPTNANVGATVNGEVRLWINRLRARTKNSKFILEFLDLIPSMLEVDVEKRIPSGVLNKMLSEMVVQARKNPNFLMETRSLPELDEPAQVGSEQGTPLPLRPSIVPDTVTSQSRSRNRSKYNWYLVAKLKAPPGQEPPNQAKDRWRRAAYHAREQSPAATPDDTNSPEDGVN